MQVRPKDFAVHTFSGLQQVVVVVPVNTHIQETHDIAEKHRHLTTERREARTVRSPQVEHHNGDDDREYSIAEGFHATLLHLLNPAHPEESTKLLTKPCGGKWLAGNLTVVDFDGRELRFSTHSVARRCTWHGTSTLLA